MSEFYIGIMSGTSVDGIDAVIAEITEANRQFKIHATHTCIFPDTIGTSIKDLFEPSHNEIDRLGELDSALGEIYSQCVLELLKKSGVKAQSIIAIGNHGQTIRHRPNNRHPFSLQIGNAATLAAATGIPVIYDFRRGDIAVGGQGAPLAPGFHHYTFSHNAKNICVINIGGMANITLLPANGDVKGWDTGPGNGLMDAWISRHQLKLYDDEGKWAATGVVNGELLTTLLQHPYFKKLPPKSTGKEEFTLDWATQNTASLPTQDVQRTLLELTAITIATAIQGRDVETAYICGGGAYNTLLLQRLKALCPTIDMSTTASVGIQPTWVEAAAFAWLAHQFWHKLPGNIPSVTGASRPAILGSITYP